MVTRPVGVIGAAHIAFQTFGILRNSSLGTVGVLESHAHSLDARAWATLCPSSQISGMSLEARTLVVSLRQKCEMIPKGKY